MLLHRREHIQRLFSMFITNQRFDTPFDVGNYDGGLNFLGVLGQVKVHEIENRTATLCFEWKGAVSEPKAKDDYKDLKPNVLYDFNGSGNHFDNPDPRYLLPVGSSGLILKSIVIDDENELLRHWLLRKGFYYRTYQWIKKMPLIRNYLLSKAWHEIYELNKLCRAGTFVISISHKDKI